MMAGSPDGQRRDEVPLEELIPRLKDRAVVLDINARVVEQNQIVVWDESHQKITIPGRPVGLRLVGDNMAVAVQFTPYLRLKGQNLLVAQCQVWMDSSGRGRYHTSIQTIPLEFNEPIYFFPLGPVTNVDAARIEVILTMRQYQDVPLSETGVPAKAED
jgi:hypothetical protein